MNFREKYFDLYQMGFYERTPPNFFETFIPYLENGGIYEEKNFEICFYVSDENDEKTIGWTGQKKTYFGPEEDVETILYYELHSPHLTHIYLGEKYYKNFGEIREELFQNLSKGVSSYYEKLGINRFYNPDGKYISTNFFYEGRDIHKAIVKLARDYIGIYQFEPHIIY